MDTYEYEKYVATNEEVKETLSKYGVAIVPNILNDEECSNMFNGMWDYFEHITQDWDIPMNRNNNTSWKQLYKLYPLHSMLIQHWNVGHSQVTWDVRQNPKIVETFSKIWDCNQEDLLVSFDGLSFNPPPEVMNRGWNKNNTWYHVDQSYTRNDFSCIQSWVTALDVNDGDATLSFYEGSNRYHKECSTQFDVTEKFDWYKLNKEEEQFYIYKHCLRKNIKCPKGSLVLWDSRTVHCGIEASKTREQPNFRSIIYLCYMPRRLASDKIIIKKQKAFNELRTTNHYPCNPKLFPKNPRTYGNELPNIKIIDKPNVTELGLKLAGF